MSISEQQKIMSPAVQESVQAALEQERPVLYLEAALANKHPFYAFTIQRIWEILSTYEIVIDDSTYEDILLRVRSIRIACSRLEWADYLQIDNLMANLILDEIYQDGKFDEQDIKIFEFIFSFSSYFHACIASFNVDGLYSSNNKVVANFVSGSHRTGRREYVFFHEASHAADDILKPLLKELNQKPLPHTPTSHTMLAITSLGVDYILFPSIALTLLLNLWCLILSNENLQTRTQTALEFQLAITVFLKVVQTMYYHQYLNRPQEQRANGVVRKKGGLAHVRLLPDAEGPEQG